MVVCMLAPISHARPGGKREGAVRVFGNCDERSGGKEPVFRNFTIFGHSGHGKFRKI